MTSNRPVLLVLNDDEGLIEAAPSTKRLRELADVRFLHGTLQDEPFEKLDDVNVLLAIRERTHIDQAVLEKLPSLELILQTGRHAYHIDSDVTRKRGIAVALGRGGTASRAAVAELTFALMVACSRMFPQALRAASAGEWPALVGRCLSGRRLGILGAGRQGMQVAKIARVFGMEVAAWHRLPRYQEDDIVRFDLPELLSRSDVISVHLRLSDQTRGLLDANKLAMCKSGSILVNTARGAILDENALVTALRDGPLAAAGLDVFADEPLDENSPLRSLPNVMLTPHIGWTVEEVFEEFAQIAACQLSHYRRGVLDSDVLLDPVATQVARNRFGGFSGHAS